MARSTRFAAVAVLVFLVVGFGIRTWVALSDGSAAPRDVLGGVLAVGIGIVVALAASWIWSLSVTRDLRSLRRRYPGSVFLQVRPAAGVQGVVAKERPNVRELPPLLILAADGSGVQLLLPGEFVPWVTWSRDRIRAIDYARVAEGIGSLGGIVLELDNRSRVELVGMGTGPLGVWTARRAELDAAVQAIRMRTGIPVSSSRK